MNPIILSLTQENTPMKTGMTVPEGYWEELKDSLLYQVKSDAEVKPDFEFNPTLPEPNSTFFDAQQKQILHKIKQTPEEISIPLALPKHAGYIVPENYFDANKKTISKRLYTFKVRKMVYLTAAIAASVCIFFMIYIFNVDPPQTPSPNLAQFKDSTEKEIIKQTSESPKKATPVLFTAHEPDPETIEQYLEENPEDIIIDEL